METSVFLRLEYFEISLEKLLLILLLQNLFELILSRISLALL